MLGQHHQGQQPLPPTPIGVGGSAVGTSTDQYPRKLRVGFQAVGPTRCAASRWAAQVCWVWTGWTRPRSPLRKPHAGFPFIHFLRSNKMFKPTPDLNT